ncbi:iron-containing alcohol dehydrogenase [Pseudomonas sp. NPDC086251]|uniref:iron-containing alcohol dehydrogenase n=1 Tax=Pseudomonas sp. NPDC086251 TaxID=3364431 RepID=UPI0038380BAD
MIHFVAPGDYIQGPGALSRLPFFVEQAGGVAVIVTDEVVLAKVKQQLGVVFGAERMPPALCIGPEVTYTAIESLCLTMPADATVVVGMGGGKAIDMAKGMADAKSIPMISVPTVASNDGPTARVYAVYDDDHRLVAIEHMKSSPLAVIVDTKLLINSPLRLMRSGIGDAIAKTFEAEAAWNARGSNMQGSAAPELARAIARSCYDTIRQYALPGLSAMWMGEPDEAFEKLVEACVLMSGLGFENGGLSTAHAVTRGLTQSRHGKHATHGEHVAYGVLVQARIEGRTGVELDDLTSFIEAVGLPTSLFALSGKPADEQDFDQIAKFALEASYSANFPESMSRTSLINAMKGIEIRAAAQQMSLGA